MLGVMSFGVHRDLFRFILISYCGSWRRNTFILLVERLPTTPIIGGSLYIGEHLPWPTQLCVLIAPALYMTVAVVLVVVAIILLVVTKGKLGYLNPNADEVNPPIGGELVTSQY